MNFIPQKPHGRIFNYYCTWDMQGYTAYSRNEYAGKTSRDAISYDMLFSEEDGLFTHNPSGIRGDIFALLDDGWDVADGQKQGPNEDAKFGSLVLDAKKFPQWAHLEPRERLKAISDKVKEAGYAGLGLWVPSHHFGEDLTLPWDERRNAGAAAWEEYAKMCAYADIKYLKVDWGYHGRDVVYRKKMTDAVKKYSPDTLMEHVIGIFKDPCDLLPEELHANPEYRNFMNIGKETVAISDVYRTYDVVSDFANVTTLMRLAELFDLNAKTDPKLCGIINVEDSVTLAAGLGMSMGIMRHEQKDGKYAENEVVRALRWQRLAPPFRLDSCENLHSDELLYDDKHFRADINRWWHKDEVTIRQCAPALSSRNAPLAEVIKDENGDMPFVINSLNPETGAYTVAALPRCLHGKKLVPLCDVSVKGAKEKEPIGIFGAYKSLSVVFDSDISGKTVYAQNLMSDEALDITDRVTTDGHILKLGGKLIEKIGSDGNTEDNSIKGILVILR